MTAKKHAQTDRFVLIEERDFPKIHHFTTVTLPIGHSDPYKSAYFNGLIE